MDSEKRTVGVEDAVNITVNLPSIVIVQFRRGEWGGN